MGDSATTRVAINDPGSHTTPYTAREAIILSRPKLNKPMTASATGTKARRILSGHHL